MYVIEDLKDEEVAKTFYEKELQKTNQTNFRINRLLRRKSDRLYFIVGILK